MADLCDRCDLPQLDSATSPPRYWPSRLCPLPYTSVDAAWGRWRHSVVAVVGSFGGLAAYRRLLGGLPPSFPAPIVIVQHRPAVNDHMLAGVLQPVCPLPVVELRDGDQIYPGIVHVTPGRSVTTLQRSGAQAVVSVSVSPDPAATGGDALFKSAAGLWASGVIAVVLSGRLSDGATGVRYVKGAGGRVLVQDPAECAAPGMPQAALSTGCVDFMLPAAGLADALTALVMAPGAGELMRVPLPSWAVPIAPTGNPLLGADGLAS